MTPLRISIKTHFVLTLFVFLATASLHSTALANEAPLGLTWGMTAEDLANAGVVLSETRTENGLSIYRSTSMPANISDAEFYSLIIHEEHGLVKVEILSEDFRNDILGSAGKTRYADLKQTLTERYGEPTQSLEQSGITLYDEPDEFYQCLEYDGCGLWLSVFEADGLSIVLRLRGLGRGEGYYRLTYESRLFGEALDEIEASNSESDASAL